MFTVVFIPMERATASHEAARETIRKFINAGSTKKFSSPEERQPALTGWHALLRKFLTEGDQVLISVMEHHSNIIPWQEVCRKTGAELSYVYLKDGSLDLEDLTS